MCKFNKKFIIIFIIILFYRYYFYFSINNNKVIFTFWEPKKKIPGYLSLCIKTWKKYLPEYKVIVLDYKKSKYYLGEKLYSSIICNDMHPMVQADAIRVAILCKYGGIWMDADNILINGSFIQRFNNFELGMIWDKSSQFPFIGFIIASKNSVILNEWLKKIIRNVKKFKEIMTKKENTTNWFKSWKSVYNWYYLGNGILNPLIKNITDKKFLGIDRNYIKVFPELLYTNKYSIGFSYKLYNLFFFEKGDPLLVLNYSKDFVFLQNSWTPLKYKAMSEKEFLNQDILLSKLLGILLKDKS